MEIVRDMGDEEIDKKNENERRKALDKLWTWWPNVVM